ncbi:MAG TPA: hypothetical protein VN784_13300 [Candidatus Limnocylindrales bacterium]|nr:hypothetical protein [Candidatus Limnocylindrales bacterium]
MNLNDNPIFLTQKRLVHRGGVLAAILIAALVGLSLLSGLVAYLADPMDFPGFKSAQEAGKMFYGWTIGVEILVLIVGGFSRISRALADERKAGLWDSNRLTPLKPSQLVIGYWLGSPLREFYMAVVLAGIGLIIVLLGRLPVTLWLGTQILIFSTTLFFGLLAVIVGLVLQRPQGGIIFLVVFIFSQFPSFGTPKFIVTNFLLPIYGIANLFRDAGDSDNNNSISAWNGLPEIFGLPIYPILLSLALQVIIGVFLWNATVRKTTSPFQPPMLRWEAVAIFGILLLVQHGLIWGLWHGRFPEVQSWAGRPRFYQSDPLLSMIHCGTMLLAIIILAAASPQPETVRVKALRLGIKNLGAIFSGSAVSLAVVLAAVAAGILLLQCALSFGNSWKIYLIAVGNLLAFFLIFSLLLEFCRLRFRRRALGFVALWLFVLCILPFILAGVFSNEAFAKLSLLAPGAVVLAGSNTADLKFLAECTFAHLGIALLLFFAWQRQWKLLLAPQSAPVAK